MGTLSTLTRRFRKQKLTTRRNCLGLVDICEIISKLTGRPIPNTKARRWKFARSYEAEVSTQPLDLASAPMIIVPAPRPKFAARKAEREAFYASDAWRELRYRAFKQYGRLCAVCGRSPPEVKLHVDHIKPRSKYPELSLDITNIQILCEDDNLGKGAWDETDWRIPHANKH